MKRRNSFKFYFLLLAGAATLAAKNGSIEIADPALEPVAPILEPSAKYSPIARGFQGIPGLALSPGGTLWAVWYAGGSGEGAENYIVSAKSEDDGKTWSEPQFVVDPPGAVRAYDPVPWTDPQGRLWIFYSQSFGWWDGRAGVWAITTDDPDQESPHWSPPRRFADGIMMNKPTVRQDGTWLLPVAIWPIEPELGQLSDLERQVMQQHIHWSPENVGAHAYLSTDNGVSFTKLGTATAADVRHQEHMFVERGDRTVWMLIRTLYGIAESVSLDGGQSWTPGEPSSIPHVPSRFFIRRLESGRLLMVKHNPRLDTAWLSRRSLSETVKNRTHLTAYLSDDDGMTWRGGLVLDERLAVSYPDGDQAADGSIYIIYDYNRHTDGEILMARFTEEDVLAGEIVTPESALRILVSKTSSFQ